MILDKFVVQTLPRWKLEPLRGEEGEGPKNRIKRLTRRNEKLFESFPTQHHGALVTTFDLRFIS